MFLSISIQGYRWTRRSKRCAMLCIPGSWTQASSTFLFYSDVTSQVSLLQYLCTVTFKLSSTTRIWLIKAEKQAAHKHLIANVYNDPEHFEPFNITLPSACWQEWQHLDFWNNHWSIKYHSTRTGFSVCPQSLFPGLVLLFRPPNCRIIHTLISFKDENLKFQLLQLPGFPPLYVTNHQVI